MMRELDARTTPEGDVVVLRWNDETDSVELLVESPRGGTQHVAVEPQDAADAFQHPYAYLPRPRGDEHGARDRAT